MLEAGAEISSQARSGDTPMKLAIKRDSFECVELLVQYGALVAETDIKLALEVLKLDFFGVKY